MLAKGYANERDRQMNRQQLESLHRVFCRDPDGAQSFLQFRRRAMRATFDTSYMIRWCGMWLGIEPDGYTHS
jgi:hypothetical protein